MDPTREPQPSPEIPSDDEIVSYLRDRAPDLPTTRFDARAVTARARGAQRRLRRRRLQYSYVAGAAAAAAYFVLALVFAVVGPVPVPGLGPVDLPGAAAIRDAAGGLLPGPPGPDEWLADVDRLDAEVRPLAEELRLDYFLQAPGHCSGIEYGRGDFSDPVCTDRAPFDDQALADFERMAGAVERTDVAVERIMRVGIGLWVQLEDSSWQYNWQYVYLPDGASPPAKNWPEEEWTHVSGDWWFHRDHDD